MLPSDASALAKAARIMFRGAPQPARARGADKRVLPADSNTTSPTQRAICQTSISLEALTLLWLPRRLAEFTPLPIGRQAYMVVARDRGRLMS